MNTIQQLLFSILALQSILGFSQFPTNINNPEVMLKNGVIKHTEYTENDSISYYYNSTGQIDHSMNILNGHEYINGKRTHYIQYWLHNYIYNIHGNLIKETQTLKTKNDSTFVVQYSKAYIYNQSNLLTQKSIFDENGSLSKTYRYYYRDTSLIRSATGDTSCFSSIESPNIKCDSILYYYNNTGFQVKSRNYTNGYCNDSTIISYANDTTFWRSTNKYTKGLDLVFIIEDDLSRITEIHFSGTSITKWYFLENGLLEYHETEYLDTKKTIRTVYKYESLN